MALMKRFEVVVQNAAGEPVSGASVEFRKQGATADATGTLTTIPVQHVGAIVAGDEVALDATTSPTRTVSSVAGPSPMEVVVGGLGHAVIDNVSRLTVTSPLPTVYTDADGTETKSQPTSTDANGMAFCYAPFDYLDAAVGVTNGGAAPSGPVTPILRADVEGRGIGNNVSSVIDSNGSVIAYILNTIRTLVNAGSKILSLQNGGSEKASLDKDGKITTAGGLVTTGSGTITSAGLITGQAGITASAGDVQAVAGDFDGRRLRLNNGTPLVTGDFVLSAGWGSTASLALNDPGNEFDSRAQFGVTANGSGIAANPTITFTFKDGAYSDEPRMVVCRTNSVAPTTGFWVVNCDATTATFVFVGTPVAGTEYGCAWIMAG